MKKANTLSNLSTVWLGTRNTSCGVGEEGGG